MTEASRDLSDRDRDREHLELVGRTVDGKYAVRRLIGRGGMGAVYEAEHLGIGKSVAIKFIDREWAKDDVVASRFAREARAASSIESEHIVTVFDAGTDAGRPYLVMELLRGEDLGRRLRRNVRLPADESIHIVAQLLRGLASAHAAGIVHRDLKPDNVFLVRREDEGSFVKIVDFGISKIERAKSGTAPLALTQKGIVLGTPLYMSPEQAQAFADLDARADLFSVGAILFECLSGRPPHTGETYEQVIVSICMRDAPDVRAVVPSVPDNVAAVVARALKRDRAERFQSASEMIAALREVAPGDAATRPLSLPHAPAVIASSAVIASPPRAPDVSGVFAPRAVAAPPTPAHPTDVSWTSRSNAAAPIDEEAYEAPGTRSRLPLIATAVLATIVGVALTLGIVRATRAPDAAATSSATSTSSTSTSSTATSTATSTSTSSTPTPTPVLTLTPTRTPTPARTPSPKSSAPPTPPPPLPPKPSVLDIHREPPP